MKRIFFILCFWVFFLILYTPLIYSEIKKPELGTEIKPDCKECHSRSKVMKGSEKPAVQGQGIRKGDDKPIPPPDHIRKDKRGKAGQQ